MLNERRIRVGDRVTIYPRGKRGVWTADYWWKGQHCRTSLKTRVQRRAEKLADRLEIRLQDGLGPFEKAPTMKVTIQQATDEFLTYQKTEKKRSKTCVKYRGLFKTFIAFANSKGVHEMRDVDLRFVDKFREYRRVKIGDRSMHNDGVMLKTCFGWCVERQLMAMNPLGTRKFRRPRYEPRGGPTLEQVDAILAIAPPMLMPIIAVAAFIGRRSGEIQHLLKEDVDFEGNWIHIVSRLGAETKSGNSRKVPMHRRLRAILEALPAASSKWFFASPPSPQFPAGGHHLNMRDVNEQFQALLRQLDIPAGKKHGGFTFHSLRSFFKTHCVNALIPREIVDFWQDHTGDRRPTAGDLYYKLADEESQRFMKQVPFGTGMPAANAGVQETKE